MSRAWWVVIAAALTIAAADEASDPEGLLEPVFGKWIIIFIKLFELNSMFSFFIVGSYFWF